MTARAARPLSGWRWLGLPALACVAGTLLLAVPLRFGGFSLPEPVFAMAPAFAWALIRPSVAAPFVVLSLGLFLDLLWGSALGLWGLSLVLAYGGALVGRKLVLGQSRPVLFAWYAGLTATAFLCAWLVSTIDTGVMPDVTATLWQTAATVALYPLADYVLGLFEDEARRL